MKTAAIIEAIRTWISACPLLKEHALLSVDQLVADAVGYTIDAVPCDPIVTQYVDGSSVRQLLFVFASREKYGTTTAQNIANSEFYEKFSEWIQKQSRIGLLPELGDYRSAQQIEITSSSYVYDTGTGTARYQIQLRFTYYQDRRYLQNG